MMTDPIEPPAPDRPSPSEVADLLLAGGVPRRFQRSAWNALDERRGLRGTIMQRMETWSAKLARDEHDQGAGLWMFGGKGVGKTRAAACIASEWAASHAEYDPWKQKWRLWDDQLRTIIPRLLWCDWSSYVEHLHAMIRDRKSKDTLTSAYRYCDVLVIDDIGKGGVTPYMLHRMFGVVSARYNEELTTIVTCNASPADLFEPMMRAEVDGARPYEDNAEALWSRFSEMCEVIMVPGRDARRGR